MPDTSLAPGCYASPLIYKAKAKECAECVFGSACGPSATARLAVLRDHYGVKPATPVIIRPVEELPKKSQQIVDRIKSTGADLGQMMLAGRNPFKSKPQFLKLACHLLIAIPGGVSRDNLRYAFKSKLNWTDGTAAAHVLQATQVLCALGAAIETNGLITLKRTT